jgi:hypothetical protein
LKKKDYNYAITDSTPLSVIQQKENEMLNNKQKEDHEWYSNFIWDFMKWIYIKEEKKLAQA